MIRLRDADESLSLITGGLAHHNRLTARAGRLVHHDEVLYTERRISHIKEWRGRSSASTTSDGHLAGLNLNGVIV